tara:strand:- start:649 stop:939 length:291 start_codon:yes stop_codon:yes gene_type:complete
MSTAAVSVGTTATAIAVTNYKRISLIIENNSAQVVRIGDGSGVTVASGIALDPGIKMKWEFEGGEHHQFFYRGDIYGIVSTGTADVRVIEFVEQRT